MPWWPCEASARPSSSPLDGSKGKPAHRRLPAAGPYSLPIKVSGTLLIQEHGYWKRKEQKRCHIVLQGKVKKSYRRRRRGNPRIDTGARGKCAGIASCVVLQLKPRGFSALLSF
jgi:hypothetical protein